MGYPASGYGIGENEMNVLLLGVSHWHAEIHLDAVTYGHDTVVGVWDEDVEKAQAFAHKFGLESILELDAAIDLKPDLVISMGHPNAVPSQARKIIERGIPMILEKPAAPSTAMIKELAELATRKNGFVGVPLPNRFGPTMRDYDLHSRTQGAQVKHAHFTLVNGPPQRYRDDGVDWLLNPKIGGGGALRNLGIHGIDCALYLAQGKLKVVAARVQNRIYKEDVEDHAFVMMEDEAGALFTVEVGYTYASMKAGGEFSWRIVTDCRTASDWGDRAEVAVLGEAERITLVPDPTATRYRLYMQDVKRSLAAGEQPSISIHDYLAAMDIIDAAYEKAKEC